MQTCMISALSWYSSMQFCMFEHLPVVANAGGISARSSCLGDFHLHGSWSALQSAACSYSFALKSCDRVVLLLISEIMSGEFCMSFADWRYRFTHLNMDRYLFFLLHRSFYLIFFSVGFLRTVGGTNKAS